MMNKKLIIATLVTISLFCVGYSGETVGTILAGGIAGCAMNEAYQEVKKPVPPPAPSRQAAPPEVERQYRQSARQECIAGCDRRFPEPAMYDAFNKCAAACR